MVHFASEASKSKMLPEPRPPVVKTGLYSATVFLFDVSLGHRCRFHRCKNKNDSNDDRQNVSKLHTLSCHALSCLIDYLIRIICLIRGETKLFVFTVHSRQEKRHLRIVC